MKILWLRPLPESPQKHPQSGLQLTLSSLWLPDREGQNTSIPNFQTQDSRLTCTQPLPHRSALPEAPTIPVPSCQKTPPARRRSTPEPSLPTLLLLCPWSLLHHTAPLPPPHLPVLLGSFQRHYLMSCRLCVLNTAMSKRLVGSGGGECFFFNTVAASLSHHSHTGHNSVVISIFTELGNHPQDLILEHFITPKRNPTPISI